MSQLDLVVFGATGFTGRHAVEHLAKENSPFSKLTWGIAGRSKAKLEDLLKDVSKLTGTDLSGVRVIIAEVGDAESLRAMCSQARVVVNCCGPYRLYGEAVVRAAIDAGTHYVDVSGEPQFIESMQLHYDQAARDKRVVVVSACGVDSVPNDLGVLFLERNFKGTVNSIESYMSGCMTQKLPREAYTNGMINYGTWQSLVESLAHYDELKPLRKKLFPERLPTFKPKLQARSLPKMNDRGWSVPFLGADNSIVYRTQRYLYEREEKRPIQFRAYLQLPSFVYLCLYLILGALLLAMTKTKFTMNLLLDYPGLFTFGYITKENPKKEVVANTRFTVELVGEGWPADADLGTQPSRTVTARISALDPGYGFTTMALLLCANTIITEKEKLPSTGGVLTTGAAFGKTNLISNLQRYATFEIIEHH